MAGKDAAMSARPTTAPSVVGTRPLDRLWAGGRRWLLLAVAALFCVGLSSALLAVAPVRVVISAQATTLTVEVDGRRQEVALAAPVEAVRLPAPPPHQREYQIDGSDSTNTFTFDPAYFARLAASPYYRIQAWLRDDERYSRWENFIVRDGSGRIVQQQARPPNDVAVPLPTVFRLQLALERLETPRTLELLDRQGGVIRLTIDRNDRYVRLTATRPEGGTRELATRYFPVSWISPLAEVLYLLLRAVAVALALAALLSLIALVAPAWPLAAPERLATPAALGAAALVMAASAYGAVVLFARAPHILDAVAYYLQAMTFAGGHVTAPAPSVSAAFPTPFFVVHDGRWFSQYPPGTALVLAVGVLAGVPWLAEPLLAALATIVTFAVARRQYGLPTALVAALLMATSPFLLLQAGTFLSHVPAMAFLTLVLYAVTRYLEAPRRRWLLLGATGVGCAFLCREVAAVLYAVPVFVFTLTQSRRRGSRLAGDIALATGFLAVFLIAYLLYTWAVTGAPFLTPRSLFNPGDQYGFGQGIGFYGRHTLGAGLVNTDELLTSLNISLFGWPFYCTTALMLAPFLLRRPQPWEALYGSIVALYVLAYVGYFYHGIALGPRYYFEALPAMILLSVRGFQALGQRAAVILQHWGRPAAVARARLVTLGLLAVLLACNLLYFLPRQVTLYTGFTGLPGGRGPTPGGFLRMALSGPDSTLRNAVVTTDDWWYYSVYMAALNCPRLDCSTVFAFAPDAATQRALRAAYPGREWYRLVEQDGRLEAIKA